MKIALTFTFHRGLFITISMAFCCGKESVQGQDYIQTYDKINKPKKGPFGLQATGESSDWDPRKALHNIKKHHFPAPKSAKQAARLTSGDISKFSQRQIRKSNYEQLIEQYRGKPQKWSDPDFLPNDKSWGVRGDKVVWKRASQIIKDPTFVSDNFTPGDILQGRLGNCYFLSAIAGIAQYPYRIKKVFSRTQLNQNGIYMARVLFKGVYQEVVVDDYFPCSPKGDLLAAQPAGGRQIWVMIVEKAWAKLHGSYNIIDGGLPNQPLHAFSAAPTDNYLVKEYRHNLDTLFKLMHEADRKDEIVCCGTEPQTFEGKLEKVGLVGGHAYTVLGVYDEPFPMLKIRNPWGNVEWKGTASDCDSNFWGQVSSQDKLNLGYTNKDDGTFFMLWQDFDKFFIIIDICHIEDNANYFYKELCFKKGKGEYFDFFTTGGNLTLALSQQSKRYRKAKGKPSKLNKASIILGRQVGQNIYEHVDCKSTESKHDLQIQMPGMQEGSYMVCCFLDGKQSESFGTVNVYSGNNMSLLQAQGRTQDFLSKCYLDHAKKNQYGKQILSMQPEEWVAFDLMTDGCGIGYSAFHIDQKSTRKLGLEFDQKQYNDNGLQLLEPYRGQNRFKLICERGQELIVLCRLIPSSYFGEFTMPVPKMFRLR